MPNLTIPQKLTSVALSEFCLSNFDVQSPSSSGKKLFYSEKFNVVNCCDLITVVKISSIEDKRI